MCTIKYSHREIVIYVVTFRCNMVPLMNYIWQIHRKCLSNMVELNDSENDAITIVETRTGKALQMALYLAYWWKSFMQQCS